MASVEGFVDTPLFLQEVPKVILLLDSKELFPFRVSRCDKIMKLSRGDSLVGTVGIATPQ